MVVNRHGENFLRSFLFDDILIENRLDLKRFWQPARRLRLQFVSIVLCNDLIAQLYALINIDEGPAMSFFTSS
jgi:hypothetical protein